MSMGDDCPLERRRPNEELKAHQSQSIYNVATCDATAEKSISRSGRACNFGGVESIRNVLRLNTLSLGLYSLALVCVVGCSAESKLRKEGATPYVRCVAGPEPDERSLRAGPWTLELKKRVLQVQGPTRALRLAAVSAPGLGDPLGSAALATLREANPDLLVLLGGVGDGPALASATFKALASLSMPSLIVLGGRDTWAAHEKAFEELPPSARIIDATVLRAIRIGNHTLVPLPGAEKGRYALQATACGFDQSDLDEAAKELGAAPAGETRWLLSWQAPTQVAGTLGPRTGAGAPLGSPLLTQFAAKVGAKGALYAWPTDEMSAARAGPLGVAAVPRLFGPRLETSSGSRLANGVLMLEVGVDGVRVL
jgi:hypothetical protein